VKALGLAVANETHAANAGENPPNMPSQARMETTRAFPRSGASAGPFPALAGAPDHAIHTKGQTLSTGTVAT